MRDHFWLSNANGQPRAADLFDHPYEMTEAMCRALKPGGRLVFVEFRGEDATVPIKRVHKMTEAQVKKEMAAHPLEPGKAEWGGFLPPRAS